MASRYVFRGFRSTQGLVFTHPYCNLVEREAKHLLKASCPHGFVVDGKGLKMSKSAGNVISPDDILKNYGADILRVWVASSDYGEDLRIDKSILSQHAESYRKIRNTFRFILGNIKMISKKQNYNEVNVKRTTRA